MSAGIPAPARALLARFGAAWRIAEITSQARTANLVWRIEIGQESFALRAPRVPDDVTLVDRGAELAAHRAAAAAGLAPEVVATDESAGVLITRWLDGTTWSYDRAREDEAIIAIAAVFRRLHSLPPPSGARPIRIGELIERYVSQLDAMKGEAARAVESVEAVEACRSLRPAAARRLAAVGHVEGVLCHNDVHHRNIVQQASTVRLIDWEYAGIGPASFDLASYAGYHDLDGRSTALLLDACGADIAAADFEHWRWLFDYVRALWGTVTASTDRAGDPAPVLQRLLSAH